MLNSDTLKVTGVDSKGYGKVYKVAMRDTGITLTAKALLAYLCAYAGRGTSAFPKREKVLRDMNLNKDTFCKHMKLIEDAGYILCHKTTTGTVYEIKTSIMDVNGTEMELKSAGYGTIPKMVVLDTNLSIKAKGLYAYLCSFSGAGKEAWPKVGTITRDLDISKNSLRKYMGELELHGYVSVNQKVDNGRFAANLYTLNDYIRVHSVTDKVESKATEDNFHEASFGADEFAERVETYVESVGNYVENPVYSFDVQPPLSGIAMYENTMPQNFWQRNTNNNPTNNNNSFHELSEVENIHAPTHARDDVKEPCVPPMTKTEVKELINYIAIYSECIAWAGIKDTLGHFTRSDDKEQFIKQSKRVLDELTHQVFLFFKQKEKSVRVGEDIYSLDELRDWFVSYATVEDLSYLCVETADKGSEVSCLKKYFKTCVINLAIKSKEANSASCCAPTG